MCSFSLVSAVPRSWAQEPPTYTNVEVVSVDAKNRLLVIRTNDGARKTVELDDRVASFGDIRSGDKVIVGLRQSPGRARVSSITKSSKVSAVISESAAVTEVARIEKSSPAAAAAFRDRVATLAEEAKRVDSLWTQFRDACSVTVSGKYEDSREWLSLWDSAARVDLSSGFCRDLNNQVIGLGTGVNEGMRTAEESARKSVSGAEMREIRRRYAMDWDRWGAPAPERREQ
jgi:hypothetical protein